MEGEPKKCETCGYTIANGQLICFVCEPRRQTRELQRIARALEAIVDVLTVPARLVRTIRWRLTRKVR